MKLEPSKPALKLILIVSVLLTLASAAALGMAISRGVRSNNWLSVPAVVAERPFGLGNRSRSNSNGGLPNVAGPLFAENTPCCTLVVFCFDTLFASLLISVL